MDDRSLRIEVRQVIFDNFFHAFIELLDGDFHCALWRFRFVLDFENYTPVCRGIEELQLAGASFVDFHPILYCIEFAEVRDRKNQQVQNTLDNMFVEVL